MLINQIKNKLRIGNVLLQTISVSEKLYNAQISILRLDLIHEQISGNKWFKLQYYFQAFYTSEKSKLATFGGAFSNHIAATSAACNALGINCVGFIRGEKPENLSPTLGLAKQLGMELIFVPWDQYKHKDAIMVTFPEYYWVAEGGYGELGAEGARDIWNYIAEKDNYDQIFLPVGSGTTIAGILNGTNDSQQVLGVSVMKNNLSLGNEIRQLVRLEKLKQFSLLEDYHFGGYAKKTTDLLNFMNRIWIDYQIPLDFVYTGKAFYAMMDILGKQQISPQVKTLFIHTGGLQGNKSLPNGTLRY